MLMVFNLKNSLFNFTLRSLNTLPGTRHRSDDPPMIVSERLRMGVQFPINYVVEADTGASLLYRAV